MAVMLRLSEQRLDQTLNLSIHPHNDPVIAPDSLDLISTFKYALFLIHHSYPLVCRELSTSLGLVLCRLLETALARRSPFRPLVSRSPFTLPTLMLGTRLALLVWSSAHTPDT